MNSDFKMLEFKTEKKQIENIPFCIKPIFCHYHKVVRNISLIAFSEFPKHLVYQRVFKTDPSHPYDCARRI